MKTAACSAAGRSREAGDGMIRLRYGNTNTYLLTGSGGSLLIDTDYAGTLPAFFREIKKQQILVEDITYLLATHYHPDHMGLVRELMELGVGLLLVDVQLPFVHFSDPIFRREPRLGFRPVREQDAMVIRCSQSRGFLRTLGISGEILHTPSHSEDSVSMVLDNGDCFVGDLEPMEYLAAYEDNGKLRADWERITERRPKRIFYSHVNEKILE